MQNPQNYAPNMVAGAVGGHGYQNPLGYGSPYQQNQWSTPNVYPMSETQLRKGLTLWDFYSRILEQLQPYSWHPHIVQIMMRWRDMMLKRGMVKSRAQILRHSLERAISNPVGTVCANHKCQCVLPSKNAIKNALIK